MPPLSIPTRTFRLIPAKNYDGKISQAIPPPPPYHASVRNAIHRNEINQITTQIQQSCSTNVFNVSASASSSTLTTNINAINASSSAMYVNRSAVKRLDKNTGETAPSDEDHTNTDELITSNEFDFDGETISRVDIDENEHDNNIETSSRIELSNEQQKQLPKQQKESNACESINDISNKESRNNLKEETIDYGSGDTDNTNEKKGRGLKVLSNVQVSPNAILNVSLHSTNTDTIPINNMIIVSSIPSTSTGTTGTTTASQVVPTQLLRSQSLLKSLNDSRSLTDTRNPKQTKGNVEVNLHF